MITKRIIPCLDVNDGRVVKGVNFVNLIDAGDPVEIAAAYDKGIMRFLTDNHIRLNITPTSNILLGRVEKLKEHPISLLYRNGVDVTINSDDVLMFDSDVSKEYLRLHESGCLSAEELDDIRENGLKSIEEIIT